VITKLGTENTPIWSIIPSVVLIGLGIFIWKRWEIRNIETKGHI
jgi:predicted transporter